MIIENSNESSSNREAKFRKLTAADFLTDFAALDIRKKPVYGLFKVKVERKDLQEYE